MPAAPVLLRAEGVRKAFGGQVVLDGVNLDLRQGEVVLLRGENGSGKTTLLNILTGNLEPDTGAIHYLADNTPRTYRFPRHWWQELNPFDHFTPEFVAREGVGRTWQDIRLFGSLSLRDNIAVAGDGHPGENPAVALLDFGVSTRYEASRNREAGDMLARLGLAGREDSSADKVSLGQSKRVAIARAVAAGARVLFLDEPLAGLDRQGIDDVVALLETLVGAHDVTLVIIEHVFNQHHLRALITTDWLLADGTLQCGDGTANGSVSSRHFDSPSLLSRPEWFDLLAGEGATVIDEKLLRGATLTRIRHPATPAAPPLPVLEIRDLVVRRGSRSVIGLDECDHEVGFNVTVFAGETVILQATNGWGKSTLFEAISGLVRPDCGSISLDGVRIDRLPVWDRIRRGLRALPSGLHTFPSLRVEEALNLAGKSVAASDLGLRQIANRSCSALSGGERQRVALASLTPGRVSLYDEPFSALDMGNASRFHALVSSAETAAHFILAPGQA